MSLFSFFSSGAETEGRAMHEGSGFFLQTNNGKDTRSARYAPNIDNQPATVVQRLRELESQALIEVEERKAFEKVRMTCEMDTYSLLLLRLVQWWDGDDSMVFWTKHGEFRGKFRGTPLVALVHAVMLFCMAAGVQMSVTWLLCQNSKATMHKWDNYENITSISLHEAAELLDEAASTGQAGFSTLNATTIGQVVYDDCLSTRKVQYQLCYFIVMLLWVAKMMPEFRQAKNIWRAIWCMEVRQNNTMPLLEADGVTILRLDWWLQALLLLFIPFVRFAVAAGVAYAGIDFILAQDTTGNIVLKALCMQFVTDIDNLFLLAFTSAGGRENVSRMRLFVNPEKSPFWTIAPDLWDNGVGGITYIVCGLMAVVIFTGCIGRVAEIGNFPIVKYNLMFFRYKCQQFCEAAAQNCPPHEIMKM